MNKNLNYLTLSYPNFTLGQIIDPEEANQNNLEILTKMNDYIDELGIVIDALSASTGATEIGASVAGLTGDNIQTILDALKVYFDTHKNNISNPHNVTPSQLNVYTKTELEPYLTGGDTLIKYEVFNILNSNNGDGTFSYTNKDSVVKTGTITAEGYQVFTLENGQYPIGGYGGRISAIVNDTLHRSKASGGLQELTTTTVALTSPEGNGAEITFMYFERVGVTGITAVEYSATQPTIDAMWFKVVG